MPPACEEAACPPPGPRDEDAAPVPCGCVEAEAGSFARWNLLPGDRLEIKGDDDA